MEKSSRNYSLQSLCEKGEIGFVDMEITITPHLLSKECDNIADNNQ